MISERDKAVLCDLARMASKEGIEFFVIGAGARFLVHDWPLRLAGGRGTTDWDIAVRVSSWDQFERLRYALTSNEAHFVADGPEHRFTHIDGRRLDVVPFGGVEAPDRTVTYPHGETTHSVLGLSECEACCTDVEVGGGASVRVVAIPGLVLLKAQTYLDRRSRMTHDVQDLDFMVETYRDTLGDAAVFERAADVLQAEVVVYEDVGAYLLAMDVRALGVAPQATEALKRLVIELTDPSSTAVDDVLRRAGDDQAQRREAIARRYSAFRLGISG